jgi:NodT family efflux transporter outer membrane factor (OMF) lipoprotein
MMSQSVTYASHPRLMNAAWLTAPQTRLLASGTSPLIASLAVLILLSSCVQQPVQPPPSKVAVPAKFDEQLPEGAVTAEQDLRSWWTVWHDPTLDELIDEALKANTDIRIAQARVAEARAMTTVAESALYPTVSAQGAAWGGGADWRTSSINALLPGLGSADPGFWGGTAGLGASWEPDVWGGRHADAAAARAVEVSAVQALNGAHVTVAADVAENYHEARGLQQRLDVLDRGIATLERLLSYVQARYEAGQAFAYDEDLVREQLSLERAQRPPLVALIEARRRRLAVLLGKPPEAAVTLPEPAPFNVPAAPIGLMPVQVVERRPDVQARVALVRAQTARLQSARTDLLPRFGIQFLGGDAELHFEGLPNLGATGGLIGLSAYLPVFNHGRIRANIAANDARLDAAVADYDAAVLRALEEVENAYRRRSALDQRSISLASALSAARRNEGASKDLYEGGRKTFRDVLDDRLQALNDEDELVQAQMGQATATVQLYRALGGGW